MENIWIAIIGFFQRLRQGMFAKKTPEKWN